MNKKLLNNSLTYIIAGLLLVGAFYFFLGNSFDSSEEKDLGHLVRISKSAEGTAYPVNIEVSGDKLTYSRNGEVFKASKEPGTSVYEIMSASGVDPSSYSVQVKNGGGIGTIFSILIGLLPFILMFGFLFFIMRQAQGGGSNAMNFGKSRAKMFVGTKANVTFFDVAGLPEAKEELEEVVEFLKFPDRFTSIGAKIPSGVLLVGPPGTGKTLLARAVAGEAGVPFFSISGSEFVEMFVGVGASRVRDLFSQAKRHSPCIIFVDEIDAVGRHRGAGLGGGHDEREQTLNQILVEMDGFDTNNNVIVIAATNRPDILDPALLRPGRFDRRVTIDNPDVNGRTEILGVHAKGKPIDSKVDLATVAKQTPGFSGADLANLINESALLAARNNAKKIHLADLTEAIDRVSIGPARKSKVISEKERKLVAYHEAGHAIVSYYMPEGKTVGKITIVSRGHAGGFTRYEQEDQSLMTKIELEAMIASLMGGREAEFLTEGVLTTGASNDFEQATRIAREAVMRYGMIPDLAQRTYGKKQQAVFLGREQNEEQDYSNETAVKIDKEIDKLLTSGKNNANKILKKQKIKIKVLNQQKEDNFFY